MLVDGVAPRRPAQPEQRPPSPGARGSATAKAAGPALRRAALHRGWGLGGLRLPPAGVPPTPKVLQCLWKSVGNVNAGT